MWRNMNLRADRPLCAVRIQDLRRREIQLCVFYCAQMDAFLVIHGVDFVHELLKAKCTVKYVPRDADGRMAMTWEPDQRHVEVLFTELVVDSVQGQGSSDAKSDRSVDQIDKDRLSS